MKYAADFRSIARDALRGKWAISVVVGLIAVLLGGTGSNGPEVKLNIELESDLISQLNHNYLDWWWLESGSASTYCWQHHLYCTGGYRYGGHLFPVG